MKKILIIILTLLTLMFSANAGEFYTFYDFTFSDATPNSLYVTGAECVDSSCSALNSNVVEIFDSVKARSCWVNNLGISNNSVFQSCMDNAKIPGNTISLTGFNQVVTKVNIPTSFGHATYFSASDDTYRVMFDRTPAYNCNFDICFDPTIYNIPFNKKANAIAQVGQLNIKNLDNKNLPVQIDVPLSVDQTVCSAFKFTNNMFKPNMPIGYSDYSANTKVTLNVKNANTNQQYYNQEIVVPIEADTCAGLASFSWTPSANIENEDVTFSIETLVVDNQVSSSIKDSANVTQKVYPTNLDGSCWTKTYDFTLSNINSFNLNTSLANINTGESLFALFTAGAYKDNAMTPMSYEARIFFNNVLVHQQLMNTGTTGPSDSSIELTNSLTGLATGNYDVRLETNPVGVCSVTSNTIQTQTLQLTSPETFNVNFVINDENNILQSGALINLELVNANNNFVNAPIYKANKTSDNLGNALFTNLLDGTYKYTVSKNGLNSVTNQITIATNSNIYVVLPMNNSAPVIDLPTSISAYYLDSVSIDLRNYVSDYNDGFDKLNFEYSLISGSATVGIINSYLVVSTTTPNNAVISVKVTDPSGVSSTDTITIKFSNNKPPVISTFGVSINNDAVPLNTTFFITVKDDDTPTTTCTLDYGDGFVVAGTCNSLDKISHVYTNIGTYTAKLTATDGDNNVSSTKKIFVIKRVNPSPHVEFFKITSSNGVIVPTNILLDWKVTHESGLPTTCIIRINGTDNNVNCEGSMNIANYDSVGTTNFNLIATDSNNNQVSRSVPITFYRKDVIIQPSEAKLIMDDVIIPGKFKFNVSIPPEIALVRNINIMPIISCGGVNNYLNNANTLLPTSIVSKSNNQILNFELTTNTRNYLLNIPTEIGCTFKTVIVDDIGSSLTLSKNVIFRYPSEPVEMQSIRGKSTDIINYMSSALSGNIVKGYNSVEFRLTNNDISSKEISMTIISSDLGIDYSLEETLGPNQKRNVYVPIFIKKQIKSGIYPLRIGVYDGLDKQVRYSYINIE